MTDEDRLDPKNITAMLVQHYSDPKYRLTFQEQGDLLRVAEIFFRSHDATGKPFAVKDIAPCPVDCGDNSCLVAWPKGGMRTNGGCRCFRHLSTEDRIKVEKAVGYWRKRAVDAEAAVKKEEP